MAYSITDACTACGLCLDICPIGAVYDDEPVYVIDDTCCDFAECVLECPEDAIVLIADGERALDPVSRSGQQSR